MNKLDISRIPDIIFYFQNDKSIIEYFRMLVLENDKQKTINEIKKLNLLILQDEEELYQLFKSYYSTELKTNRKYLSYLRAYYKSIDNEPEYRKVCIHNFCFEAPKRFS